MALAWLLMEVCLAVLLCVEWLLVTKPFERRCRIRRSIEKKVVHFRSNTEVLTTRLNVRFLPSPVIPHALWFSQSALRDWSQVMKTSLAG